MVSEIFVHIGMHYTGTTSFQMFLNTHRMELAQRGISVYRPLNNGINGAELRAAATLKRGQRHFDDVKENIAAHCRDANMQKLIISAESLWTIDSCSDIERLKALFPRDLGCIKVLFVVRDVREEEGWARRLWEVPKGTIVEAEKVRKFIAQSIKNFRKIFDSVETLTYQKQGMVEALCETCEIDVAGLKVSYSYHKKTALKRAVERRFPALIDLYARHISDSIIGRAKRRLFNE